VIPKAILSAPKLAPEEAQRQLLRIASRALGIATESDLRDYFRLDLLETRERISELVEMQMLLHVTVTGKPAYLHPDAKVPRRVAACALVSPFDPVVWERKRLERFFEFRYRIEIYVPAQKRAHGYYVLPFLLGDRFVARVDLKADRKTGALRVLAVHGEPGIEETEVANALAGELSLMTRWLGLERVQIGAIGNLGKALEARS
jgi:uncharacterized protein YcaQ